MIDIDTEVQPATTLPRDALPSELVRGWPEKSWCAYHVRLPNDDGSFGYCTIGILAYLGGFHGRQWNTRYCSIFVAVEYGIPRRILMAASEANDTLGKDDAAGVLEAAGF